MDEAKVDKVERKLGRVKEVKGKPASVVEETTQEQDVEMENMDTNVERAIERLSSSSGSSRIDMESLVEECFQEMESVDNCNEGIEVSVITFNTSSLVEECFQEIETVKNHDEDTWLSVITTSSLLRHTDPEFDLTFEEEFKIHELVVRKESLFDTLICLLLKVPQVSWLLSKFLTGPHTPTRPGIGPFIWSFLKEGVPKIWDVILNNLEEGGQIRACLDMFDEYKNVEETAKKETFQFSLRVLQICTRLESIKLTKIK